jgi:hypothetical protein
MNFKLSWSGTLRLEIGWTGCAGELAAQDGKAADREPDREQTSIGAVRLKQDDV